MAEKKIRVVAKRNGNKSKLEAVDQVPAIAAKKEYIEPPIAPDAVPFKPEPKNEAIRASCPNTSWCVRQGSIGQTLGLVSVGQSSRTDCGICGSTDRSWTDNEHLRS